jgi:hypothetical protein
MDIPIIYFIIPFLIFIKIILHYATPQVTQLHYAPQIVNQHIFYGKNNKHMGLSAAMMYA